MPTRVVIEGRVQGVYFRESTRQEADRLGVQGWVRNLPDGRVEGLLAGAADAVAQLIDWCHEGPKAASVTRVYTEPSDDEVHGDGFIVRR